jgi:Ca-activated chloride channel family protein
MYASSTGRHRGRGRTPTALARMVAWAAAGTMMAAGCQSHAPDATAEKAALVRAPVVSMPARVSPPPPSAAPPAHRARLSAALADDLEAGVEADIRAKRPSGLYGLKGGGSSYGVGALRGNTGATVVVPEPQAQPQAVERLDPNARYATTYRPGGAALAAFDAALSRGTLPTVYRDLVGDFGARYAPDVAAPTTGALALQVQTERSALAPAGGPLHLRVALRSSAAKLARAQLAVDLVIDVSGSMQGASIDNARKAAAALVERLDAKDHFSLVTFSDGARVLVPNGPIGPRRGQVLAAIARIEAEGGTNIGAGLDAGYTQARAPGLPADALRLVMLLSDGQANGGDTNPASLAARSSAAFQDGVQTSAFGVGDSFDAPLLGAIADRGAGGYYYLADPTQIAPALTRELDARLAPAALAVELRVRLRPDVVPTKVYGSRQLSRLEAAEVRGQEISADVQAERHQKIARDRQHDAEGGMRFFMPSFARDDRHAILLSLALPAGLGDRPIGSVEVRYKDRVLGRNVTTELPLRVRYARSETASAATINPSVLRTVQAFAAGDAILAAAQQVDRGDRDGAARVLAERAALLEQAAKALEEPRFREDGARLGRLASAVGGVSDPLSLAILLRGSGAGYLQ